MADRSVIARPRTTLSVPPGERARVFVSSPLWVAIIAGSGRTVLRELPAKRLSETWFGGTTLEGELAYALKTSARTQRSEMATAPYRLLTPVVIENRAGDTLLVERLNLPVPFLTIYATEEGEHWSPEVRMVRSEEGNMAELDVRRRSSAGGARGAFDRRAACDPGRGAPLPRFRHAPRNRPSARLSREGGKLWNSSRPG